MQKLIPINIFKQNTFYRITFSCKFMKIKLSNKIS